MNQCSLCERRFSRKADLAQHYNQLHPYLKRSYTSNWIQNQQQLNSVPQTPQFSIDNIWNEIRDLGDFSQAKINQDYDKREVDDNSDKSEGMYDDRSKRMDDGSDENVDGESNENVDDGSNENVDDGFNETDSRTSGTDTNVENNGNNRINKSMKGNEADSDDDERFKWINNNENEDFYRVGLNDAYEDSCNNKIDVIETLWPSEVYKEFMTAVTQHRISDAAADSMLRIIRKYCTEPLPGSTRKGRMYMDQMDIKDFNIKTKDMVDLVSNPDLSKNFLFDYKEQWEHDDNGNLVRVYSEQNSANWWRERQNPFSKILAIMIYIDGTTLDSLGRQSEYPIFLTLGNIPNWRRNSPDAKALVGFLPHLITRDNKLKGSTIFRQMQRKLEQRSFEYLFSPLLQKNGIYLAINGRIEHFTLHLSAILADMSEAQNICCTYKSYRTQCPCYKCLTPGDQLNNMNIEQNSIVLRDNNNMREAILSNKATECSIHEYNNFFWKFQTNIYDATAMDRMHLQEIGLFPYMLDYTRNMIAQQCGNQFLTKMDNRLGTITPYNNLRILSKGYQQGVKFTGAEMRDVMKIIIFVLDELYTIDNGTSCIKQNYLVQIQYLFN
ncbi:unnamed protein product [Rhizophagus irregularis]|nr:unnamed protein product [Rhizophagus irregularis]